MKVVTYSVKDKEPKMILKRIAEVGISAIRVYYIEFVPLKELEATKQGLRSRQAGSETASGWFMAGGMNNCSVRYEYS